MLKGRAFGVAIALAGMLMVTPDAALLRRHATQVAHQPARHVLAGAVPRGVAVQVKFEKAKA